MLTARRATPQDVSDDRSPDRERISASKAAPPAGKRLSVAVLCVRRLCMVCLEGVLERLPGGAETRSFTRMEDVSAALAAGYKPDVVLYSTICPTDFDLGALETLCRSLGDIPLAVHVDGDGSALFRNVIAAGARGVIPPTCSPELAVAALQLIAAGGTYVPNERRLAEPVKRTGSVDVVTGQLTDRQRAILKLTRQGKTNKEIALALGITQNTVKSHMTRLMRRFQVDSRVRLAVAASGFLSGT